MASRKLQVFHDYRYGRRGVLLPGERFRVAGGPEYVTDGGTTIPMYERGVFVFRAFCVRGASPWIEAYRADGGGGDPLGRQGRPQPHAPQSPPQALPDHRQGPRFVAQHRAGSSTHPLSKEPL